MSRGGGQTVSHSQEPRNCLHTNKMQRPIAKSEPPKHYLNPIPTSRRLPQPPATPPATPATLFLLKLVAAAITATAHKLARIIYHMVTTARDRFYERGTSPTRQRPQAAGIAKCSRKILADAHGPPISSRHAGISVPYLFDPYLFDPRDAGPLPTKQRGPTIRAFRRFAPATATNCGIFWS